MVSDLIQWLSATCGRVFQGDVSSLAEACVISPVVYTTTLQSVMLGELAGAARWSTALVQLCLHSAEERVIFANLICRMQQSICQFYCN